MNENKSCESALNVLCLYERALFRKGFALRNDLNLYFTGKIIFRSSLEIQSFVRWSIDVLTEELSNGNERTLLYKFFGNGLPTNAMSILDSFIEEMSYYEQIAPKEKKKQFDIAVKIALDFEKILYF